VRKGVRRLGFVIALIGMSAASAHDLRAAYLELHELTADRWSVLWKVPARDQLRLSIAPRFDERCHSEGVAVTYRQADAWADRWTLLCRAGLAGTAIRIERLDATFTDVLVRVVRADGSVQTGRATPAAPTFLVETSPGRWEVAETYLKLGVEHILGGIDHLLFVFGLLLLVSGWRRLLGTITAFTVAHSLTLAGTTLGWVHVPQAPVEAVIALSIVFVAAEVVHAREGRGGLAERWPWLVAFIFGLLHGFGFAGALRDVGLPSNAIPVALLFFNLGVELGQLVFVLAVVHLGRLLRKPLARLASWAWRLPAYAIGAVASFWLLDRLSQFFT
jgi:hydrogenase/urease accessory protein HupE